VLFVILTLSVCCTSVPTNQSQVINNLLIAHIELRCEDDPELQPYTHQRQIDIVVCEQGAYNGIQAVRKLLNDLMAVHLRKLQEFGILQCDNPSELNFLLIQEAERLVLCTFVACLGLILRW